MYVLLALFLLHRSVGSYYCLLSIRLDSNFHPLASPPMFSTTWPVYPLPTPTPQPPTLRTLYWKGIQNGQLFTIVETMRLT